MAAPDLRPVVEQIVQTRTATPAQRSVLVAVTGIDGCGKSYLAARIVDVLRAGGVRATAIEGRWMAEPSPPRTGRISMTSKRSTSSCWRGSIY